MRLVSPSGMAQMSMQCSGCLTEESEGSRFHAFSRSSIGWCVGINECRMNCPAGSAVETGVEGFDERSFIARHGRIPEPPVIGVVGYKLQLADPVFCAAFAGNQIRVANAGRITYRQRRG